MTDTEKWKDPWFEELSGVAKLFMFYYLDNCDCAGIWRGSFRHFQFMTNFKYTAKEMLADFDGKIFQLTNGSYFMPNFVKFQYGQLTPKSNVYKGVLKALSYNDIQIKGYSSLSKTLDIPIDSLGVTLPPTHMDKDKDNIKEGTAAKAPLPISEFELLSLWHNSTGQKIGFGLTPKERTLFLAACKIITTREDWENFIKTISTSDFIKNNPKIMRLSWVLEEENMIKIARGQFDNKSAIDLDDVFGKGPDVNDESTSELLLAIKGKYE